jgi:DNA adenine methylase
VEYNKLFDCGFIAKADEQQIVYGVVLEPEVVDAQGDIISAEEIEQAATWWMENSQTVGARHRQTADARVVQSFIAPVDFDMSGGIVRKGSWVMAVKVYDPSLWAAVKAGEITGFSIGGYGVRE